MHLLLCMYMNDKLLLAARSFILTLTLRNLFQVLCLEGYGFLSVQLLRRSSGRQYDQLTGGHIIVIIIIYDVIIIIIIIVCAVIDVVLLAKPIGATAIDPAGRGTPRPTNH